MRAWGVTCCELGAADDVWAPPKGLRESSETERRKRRRGAARREWHLGVEKPALRDAEGR